MCTLTLGKNGGTNKVKSRDWGKNLKEREGERDNVSKSERGETTMNKSGDVFFFLFFFLRRFCFFLKVQKMV